jgi:divalent metal cation (Fe/Co/Zn/Cd) transporter
VSPHERGLRIVRLGLVANAGLALAKGIAGIVGHSYALVADAAESAADIGGSIVVWSALRVSAQSPDFEHP